MTSLYNLSQEYQKFLSMDEFEEADLIALDFLQGAIEDKVVNCACVLQELKGKQAHTEAAIKIAQYKSERLQHNIDRLETYVLESLINNKIDKVDKHPLFDVKVQTNRISVDDFEKDKIPEKYWTKKETLTLNRTKVREDIEQEIEVPGARLIRKKVLKIE